MAYACSKTTPIPPLIEVGAGEPWHDVVIWALEQGFAGLENLALIPGTAGAAPVQNIGAYGLELSDRLESVDVVDLVTGRSATLPAALSAVSSTGSRSPTTRR